jgi:hypothetical protein
VACTLVVLALAGCSIATRAERSVPSSTAHVAIKAPRLPEQMDWSRPEVVSRLSQAPELPAFPLPEAIAGAQAWLAERDGVTAFAVVDSQGDLYGSNEDETFVSAGVVKAMLLVGYLRP